MMLLSFVSTLSHTVFFRFNALCMHCSDFLLVLSECCSVLSAQFAQGLPFLWRAYWSTLGASAVFSWGNAAAHFGRRTRFLISCLSPPLNIILVASGIGSVSYVEGQNRHVHIRTPHTLIDFKYLHQPMEDQIVLREIMSRVKRLNY